MAASTVETLVTTLRSNRARPEAAGIRQLMVFGSVARGDDRAGSDVDLAAVGRIIAFTDGTDREGFIAIRRPFRPSATS